MSVIRAFIAIDISAEIQAQLDRTCQQLISQLAGMPIRWVPVENIHLTLKFLGNVSVANIAMLEKILASESAQIRPFELSVGVLGAFPSTRRPRVIHIQVEAPGALAELHHRIEHETARLGYAREQRAFKPHLTLGRVTRNANAGEVRLIGETLERFRVGFLGAMRVQALHLYQSVLQPGGAVYSRLYSAPLGNLPVS